MDEAFESDECEAEDAPASALLAESRKNRYGSIPDLPDEELATPEELERQVFLQEWGPVLLLPVRGRRSPIQPHIDEYFGVDYGAFATVDFDRYRGEFDKARYKAEKLREELRNTILMMETVSGRLPAGKFRVIKLLRTGIIDLDHIESQDMLAMARYYLRARRLQGEIQQLREVSRERRLRQAAEVLA